MISFSSTQSTSYFTNRLPRGTTSLIGRDATFFIVNNVKIYFVPIHRHCSFTVSTSSRAQIRSESAKQLAVTSGDGSGRRDSQAMNLKTLRERTFSNNWEGSAMPMLMISSTTSLIMGVDHFVRSTAMPWTRVRVRCFV
ncbi:hypothetical protein EVAR_17239_1 [Eumeta japonica]|uniref:Uncharacterized protein n=1 Tax=Eumeta variegata TaxID=151549 RepID=A0A4C1TSX0_EUMVA|nr:hypothetical protein EVAR_17239_1 [Eumeta japonica]